VVELCRKGKALKMMLFKKLSCLTLFLVELSKMPKMKRPPVKVIGYADDWAVYTKDQDMSIAKNNRLDEELWVSNFH
jgi:hypothetical protein